MARMTQEELDQLLGTAGGGRLVHSNTVGKQKIKNPAHKANGGTSYTVPEELDVDIQQWKSPDGYTIRAAQMPDGGWEVLQNEPPTKPATGADARNPDQKETDRIKREEAEREAAERAKNRSLPPDQDPRDETDAQRAARADATRKEQAAKAERDAATARAEADRNKPGAPTLKPDGKGGTVAVQAMPDGTIRTTPLPGVPSDKPVPRQVTVGGVVYEAGPDGKYAPAPGLPSEGEANAGGPPLPVLVAGAIGPAARKYLQELNDSTLTTAEKEKRWKQFNDAAHIIGEEAKTVQYERESVRNLQYNQANSRATHLQSGTKDALDFVTKMNGLLPEGSTLGGDAFAALMSLNMLQMHLSGMNNLTNPGTSADTLPAIAPGTLTSPDKAVVASARAQVAAQVAQATAPPNAIGAGAIGNQPAPSAAPAPPAVRPPAPVVAAPTAPAMPGQNPDAGQALGPTGNSGPLSTPGQNPDAGQALGPAGDSGPLPAPVPPTPALPVPTPEQAPYGPMPWGQTVVPVAPSENDPGLPPTVRPTVLPEAGVTIPGTFTQPAAPPLPPNEVSMAPPAEFAALSAFSPPPRPPAPMAGPAPAGPEMAAMRLARIEATPPWELSEEDHQFATQHGREPSFWRVPGRVA